jgi:hypothetical protein
MMGFVIPSEVEESLDLSVELNTKIQRKSLS